MLITISGEVGSGKTFIGKKLANQLNLHYICIGEKFKQIAKQKGMSVTEVLNYLEKNPNQERKIDKEQKNIQEGILDSRLGFYFTKPNFNIYFKAPLEIRAKRIAERDNITLEKAKQKIIRREETETRRYKKIYGVDIRDLKNYDLVIDTEKFETNKIIKMILSLIES